MDFADRIEELAKRVKGQEAGQLNEQATKNALVMPFIAALGYDVFNPAEVAPEYSAPIGEYKDARVDYAILDEEGTPIILIECKPLGANLESRQCNQLQLYFHGTEAPIAILTDGNRYLFYSDLETQNRMDSKPYMEVVLNNLDKALVPELRKLAKGRFDRDTAMTSANELKYNREFKQIMARQLEEPHEDFVRFFISQSYDGIITQKVRERFTPVLMTALSQFIDEKINERLQNAMTKPGTGVPEQSTATPEENPDGEDVAKGTIITTEEEKEAYYLVKSLLVGTVAPERVCIKDTMSYCNILMDGKVTKQLCRLYFNSKQWRVGLFDQGEETKVDIATLDDILTLADRIRATAAAYDAKKHK